MHQDYTLDSIIFIIQQYSNFGCYKNQSATFIRSSTLKKDKTLIALWLLNLLHNNFERNKEGNKHFCMFAP